MKIIKILIVLLGVVLVICAGYAMSVDDVKTQETKVEVQNAQKSQNSINVPSSYNKEFKGDGSYNQEYERGEIKTH